MANLTTIFSIDRGSARLAVEERNGVIYFTSGHLVDPLEVSIPASREEAHELATALLIALDQPFVTGGQG